VRIGQSQAFGEIWIYWNEGGEMPVDAPVAAAVTGTAPAAPPAVAHAETLVASTPLSDQAEPAVEQMPEPAPVDTAPQPESVVPESVTPEQAPAPVAPASLSDREKQAVERSRDDQPPEPADQTNPENH
jgi:hypothetical protein